jgi:hypothetical protein
MRQPMNDPIDTIAQRKATTLVVADPQLRGPITAILNATLPGAAVVFWSRRQPAERACVHRRLEALRPEVVFSVYSDYIFSARELEGIALPINIHPALPAYPGVGYDVLPLLDRCDRHGATAHFMTAQVDAGRVVATAEVPLRPGMDYPALREANQREVVRLFGALLDRWSRSVGSAAFRRELVAEAPRVEQWSGPYISFGALRRRIERAAAADPKSIDRLQLPDSLRPPERTARPCKSA